MAVDVVIEDKSWRSAGLVPLASMGVDATLSHLGLSPEDWEVVVMGCNDARIADLNADFRGKPKPTNVLSWPSGERGADEEGRTPEPPAGAPDLGDIAIAFETCAREAEESGRTMRDHTLHLIVHGTLHLLGYDHVRNGDGDLMEAAEIAILGKLGVPNPYEGRGTAGPFDDGKD